jgi:hypothetical protein
MPQGIRPRLYTSIAKRVSLSGNKTDPEKPVTMSLTGLMEKYS